MHVHLRHYCKSVIKYETIQFAKYETKIKQINIAILEIVEKESIYVDQTSLEKQRQIKNKPFKEVSINKTESSTCMYEKQL